MRNSSFKGNGRHLRTRMRVRLSLRQKMVYMSSIGALSLVVGLGLMFYFQFSKVEEVQAAASGDYRSKASGNWNLTATWEKYDGTNWIAATVIPDKDDGAIEILSGHTVTVANNVTVDQVTVNAGATLIVASGKALTINNGTGTDLTVDGTMTLTGDLSQNGSSAIIINGTVTSNGNYTINSGATVVINNGALFRIDAGSATGSAGKWTVNSGGVYQANVDAPVLPLATWNTGSTCLITGITVTKPTNLDQSFYNLTWNSPNQTSTENLQGQIVAINGDFTFTSSGTGSVRFGQGENYTLPVGGNFTMQGGKLFECTKATTCVISVAGNYTQTGGIFGMTDALTENGEGTPTMNVTGNFSISSGTFDMTQYTNTSNGKGISTLNLSGNFSQTGGTITETATTNTNYGYGKVYFAKSGTQTFSKTSGTISNNINFTVNSGSVVDLGTSYPTGAGTFTVSSGGGLNMGSANGITSSGTSGNVQVTGTRSFSTGGDYTYNGTTAQVTGNGLPATVHNLTVNNSTGVTLTATVAVSNIFTLTSGDLTTGNYEVSVTNTSSSAVAGYSDTSYVVGNLRRAISASASYDFPVGTAANYELINFTSSSLAGITDILGYFNAADPGGVPNGMYHGNKPVQFVLNHGYWTLTPTGSLSSGSYGVTATSMGFTNAITTEASNYTIMKRHSNGNNWAIEGNENVSTNAFLSDNKMRASRSGFTTFSDFAKGGGGSGGALPIELVSFDAKRTTSVVNLTWVTGTELNNDYFTIERSVDGKHFKEVLREKGAGNSTQTLKYSATDESPLKGVAYYRLKQTDYDGKFTYSPVRAVQDKNSRMEEAISIETVSPNPFTDYFNVNYQTLAGGNVDVQIFSLSGQLVFNETLNVEKGFGTYSFNEAATLPRGIYFVNLISNGERVSKKMIKQ